ncbi:MAG: histidine kinase dimerization/phospho-acceptor domain-containing protein [Pseudomonadota bacterium]
MIDSLPRHPGEGPPWKFFKKVVIVQIIITSVGILATSFLAGYYFRTHALAMATSELKDSLGILHQTLEEGQLDPVKWCHQLDKGLSSRLTIFDGAGKILCDNFIPESQWGRVTADSEILMAKEKGSGDSFRQDYHLSMKMLFAAKTLELKKGQPSYIIRQGIPAGLLNKSIYAFDNSILVLILPMLLITTFLTIWINLRVSFPLQAILKKINLMDNKFPKNENQILLAPGNEWALLEKTLDRAKEDLENYVEELYLENKKISTLIDSITDSILAINQSHKYLFANKHFRQDFLPPEVSEKDLSTYKIWDLARHLGELQGLFDHAIRNKVVVERRNMAFMAVKERSYFDVTITPLKDSLDRVFGAIGVLHDVTQRKLNDQLREDFVSNVSHEVRTPLTALKGYVQVLKDTSFAQDLLIQNSLGKIESNANRLITLFNDVLSLSVIESKQVISKELFPPQEIISATLSNLQVLYQNKNIQVQLDIPVQDIYGNTTLLEQVMTNLLDNAFK